MPKDYTVQSSQADIQVLSATVVQNVTRFGITTKPSGVLVYVNVPVAKVSASQAHVTLQGYALLVETAMRHEGVVASHPEQDVDGSGLLADFQVFTLQVPAEDGSDDFPIQTDVPILTRMFGTAAGYAVGVEEPLDRAYAGLLSAVFGA